MATGKVKRYDETKGFGFIAPDGGGPDVFFHHSEIQGGLPSLATGQAVEFDVTQGPKGPKALKVRVVG
jgi:cold shock protein